MAGMDEREVRSGEAIVGWRYWHVLPESGRLRSVSQRRFMWMPGKPLRAGCPYRHRSPFEACGCGIYGAADLPTLREHGLCLSPMFLVVGEVALWGRVVRAGTEFRAELAYPKTLSIVSETVPKGQEAEVLEGLGAYGVPVGIMSRKEAVGEVSGMMMTFQAMSSPATQGGGDHPSE